MPDTSPRFVEIDALRGFAVLGIFQVNILYFGQPYDLYHFPILFSSNDLLNSLSWFFTTLFVEGAMYGLFSLLFGVSAMILLDQDKLKDLGALSVVDAYYRRMLWLIVFGLIHAYILLSPMEVLYTYGILGLFLFPLRNLSATSLLIIGTLLAAKGAFELNVIASAMASSIEQTGPDSTLAAVIADLRMFQSDYVTIFRDNIGVAYVWQTELFFEDQIFDAGGLMLVGMALYKMGIMSGQKSLRFYLAVSALGYVTALLLRGPLAMNFYASGFSPLEFDVQPTEPTLLARLFLILGHLGLILALFKLRLTARLFSPLAQVGKMALTHYITQSVLSILLFYGFGAGLYGRLERYELLSIAVFIALLQIVFSVVWLRYFHFGPIEWCWRSLVKQCRQPMRIASIPAGQMSGVVAP